MRVVSDASPLNYLALIDQLELLPALFEEVYIPQAVYAELTAEGTPEAVREWAANPPGWLHVHAAPAWEAPAGLHAGEREAILLAESLAADTVLIDERRARRIAQQRGLKVVGTLGVLVAASARDLLQLTEAFDRLRRTTFHVDPRHLAALLEQDSAHTPKEEPSGQPPKPTLRRSGPKTGR
jgi:predicted nucleic acid-binding protein